MSDRREVNVARPEHSWIPFYRELAGKLVNDGWRERQGELVGMLKEMGDEGLRMPPLVERLEENVDPISLLAMFNRGMNWDDHLKIIKAFSVRFDIQAETPKEDPFVPKSNRYVISNATNAEPIWDMVSTIFDIDPFDQGIDIADLIIQFDSCLRNIGISKLTAGLYWVNPRKFLHIDTINEISGKDLRVNVSNGETYFKCLLRARELDSRSFPEINIDVFKTQNPHWDPPMVWIVRGGSSGQSVGYQLENCVAGVGFGLGDVDLSQELDGDAIREAYANHHPDESSGTINANASSVANFLRDLKICDYVLMPDGDGQRIHYGKVVSDPCYVTDGPWENRRNIEWADPSLIPNRSDLPSLPTRTRTVVRATDRLKDEFLSWIENPTISDYKMPEDSWVPFHLEVGRKLIEGEWWREGRREEFARMIHEIRWADPGESTDDGTYREWSADPYSFYLSFNMRMVGGMRVPAYRKVKELLDIDSAVPSEDHVGIGLGVNWGWEPPINEEEFDFVWELFRFVSDFDPASCGPEDERRFVEFYDRAASVSFLRGKRAGWLSIWLSWIDPTKYVLTRRLARQALNLEAELEVRIGLRTGKDYLDALRRLRALGAANGFGILDVNRASTTRLDLGLDDDGSSESYTINDLLEDGVFFEKTELERILGRFKDKKNLILQGPPGVGKTFVTRRLAYALIGEKVDDRIKNVQFHQSYSYEEFVQGFRPGTNRQKQLVFELRSGTFMRMCEDARANPDDRYVMVIDEINRGNLSRVFGELLSLIEKDKRGEEFEVMLSGGRPFSVPENVYLLGTMNLADRSLAGMDYAMRRRFAFVTLKPHFGESVFEDWLTGKGVPEWMIERINSRMLALNEEIARDPSLGRNFAVGHSYFCDIPTNANELSEDAWNSWYRNIVETEIRPLLEEYWFDNATNADQEVEKLLRVSE